MSFTLKTAAEYFEENEPRGEMVLVIAGEDPDVIKAAKVREFENMSIPEHVAKYVSEGMSEKDAMKQAAKDRGISKREIYEELKI